MKTCSKCGTEKDPEGFYIDKKSKDGRACNCKGCVKGRVYLWAANNPQRVKEGHAENYLKTKKVRAEKAKAKREHLAENLRKWRANNPDRVKELLRIQNTQARSTPKGRIRLNVSHAISNSLKRGAKGGRHWEALVGFTADQLKRHLEKRFTEGMTWENYGTVWQIDHKIPVAVFNFERPEDIDFRLCWSLKNLQPLGSLQNASKGAKIEKPFQPSLAVG